MSKIREQDLITLGERIGEKLMQKGWLLTTAESCTGGWVAQVMTSIAGSSTWFERGFVTYSNLSKQEMLGVGAQTLDENGAVSEQTVKEMADGALRHSQAQMSIAISGIAGPGGGSLDKPVGTVWLAWGREGEIVAEKYHFLGDRKAVRLQAAHHALLGVLSLLEAE